MTWQCYEAIFKSMYCSMYLYFSTVSHSAFMKDSHLLQDFHHYYSYSNVVAIASF